MFLTRLGMNSKMVITGDFTQVDLPRGVPSGLRDALDKLEGIRGIGFEHFGKQDIVRHPLVSAIVERYDEREREAEQS